MPRYFPTSTDISQLQLQVEVSRLLNQSSFPSDLNDRSIVYCSQTLPGQNLSGLDLIYYYYFFFLRSINDLFKQSHMQKMAVLGPIDLTNSYITELIYSSPKKLQGVSHLQKMVIR